MAYSQRHLFQELVHLQSSTSGWADEALEEGAHKVVSERGTNNPLPSTSPGAGGPEQVLLAQEP